MPEKRRVIAWPRPMLSRRKFFAFSAAVAVSPSAAISADAEITKITNYGRGPAVTLEDIRDHTTRLLSETCHRQEFIIDSPIATLMRDRLDKFVEDHAANVLNSAPWQQ